VLKAIYERRGDMKCSNIFMRFNRLEFKIAVALFIITCTSLSFHSIIVNHSVLKNLVIIEKEKVKDTAEVVGRVPFSMATNISRIAKDYSKWDEAYENVSEKNTAWVKVNFIDWMPDNYDIDLILVTDKKKNILGSYGMEQEQLLKILDNAFVDRLIYESYSKTTEYPCGYIEINDELYIFSAQPIVPLSSEGLPAGMTLLGKKIDRTLVKNIEAETGEIAFFSHGSSLLAGNEQDSYIKEWFQSYLKNSQEDSVKILDKATIIAPKSINDFEGKEIAQMYIVKDRDIFITVTKTIEASVIIGILLSIAIVVLLLIPLKRFVINPIRSFQNQMSNLRNGDNNQGFHVEGLNAFINLTTISNEIAVSLDIHKKENNNLKLLSITDALTALYNERYFYEYFNKRMLVTDKTISAIFCDVDHFSLIKQSYGYNIGDLLLIKVAGTIRKELADSGTAFRLGNDSFMLLLDGKDKSEALRIAENIRTKVYNSSLAGRKIESIPISMSFGIVSYLEDMSDLSMLRDKAEVTLNYAKNNGGNQCQGYRSDIDSISELGREEYIKRKAEFNSVFALAVAIDVKDNYTGNHSQTVSRYVMNLAEKLGMSEKEKDDLRMGALLHDCGKIGIPDDIIRKPDKLITEEWDIVKRHPILGYDIVKYAVDNPNILSCIRNHHERWDGKGYPDELSKFNIPYYARIVCIADAYHAMISDRPYRPGLSEEMAISELRKQSAIQFDPSLVEPFIEVVMDINSKGNLIMIPQIPQVKNIDEV
jgi:diguanylate cyclase (GGDEF)-like protein